MARVRPIHYGFDAKRGEGVVTVIACHSTWWPKDVKWVPDKADATCNNCRRTLVFRGEDNA